jgi:hypothetical protein
LLVSGFSRTEGIDNHSLFSYEPLEESPRRIAIFRRIRLTGKHTNVVIYRCHRRFNRLIPDTRAFRARVSAFEILLFKRRQLLDHYPVAIGNSQPSARRYAGNTRYVDIIQRPYYDNGHATVESMCLTMLQSLWSGVK